MTPIEREFRRLERQEMLKSALPILGIGLLLGIVILGYRYFPVLTEVVVAFFTAVGLPLNMWLNRRRPPKL